VYTGRILKGPKAGRFAGAATHQARTRDQLKTAKALGLIVPDKLLALADEVIE